MRSLSNLRAFIHFLKILAFEKINVSISELLFRGIDGNLRNMYMIELAGQKQEKKNSSLIRQILL
jgi:hypothetical protein